MPFLMTREEAVPLKEAARRSGLSVDTIRRLHKRHGIGRQMAPRSPIEVSFLALLMLQHGDLAALELLRNGQRENERVSRYLALM
ncbi:hypothetical protein [Aureimonas endophytica]|nr:hypothetical protein [Aureimonas endophytica]